MEQLNEKDDCQRDAFRLCSLCAQKGLHRRLKTFHLNLREAIYMCPEPECLFPLTEKTFDTAILKRKPGIFDTGGNGRCRKKGRNDSLEGPNLNMQSCGLVEPKLFKPNVNSNPEKLVPKGSQRAADNLWTSYGAMKLSTASQGNETSLPSSEDSQLLSLSESQLETQPSKSVVSVTAPPAASSLSTVVPSPVLNRPLSAPVKLLQPIVPRIPVETLTVSSGNERLQRAREKFLREKDGVRGSAVGPVIPRVCSVPNLVAATVGKPRGSAPTSRHTGVKPSSFNGGLHDAKKLDTPAAAASILSVQKPRPPPILHTIRPRHAFSNPYVSVLPLLHKGPRGAALSSSSVFSGYVPKSKNLQPSVEPNVPSSTPASPAQSEDDLQNLSSSDVRRSRVSFALPDQVELKAPVNNESSMQSGISTLASQTSWSNNVPLDVHSTNQTSLVSAGNATNSSLIVSVDNFNSNQLVSCNPAPDLSVRSLFDRFIDGEVSSENKDTSLEVVENWLCDEIYASDMFKSKGLCPESLIEDAKYLLENGDTALVSSRDASTNCDILNEGGFQKLDLFISEAFSQSAFDDMLSYLCT